METGNNVKPQQGINTPSATPNANAATDSTAATNASPNAPTVTPNDVLTAEVKEDFAKYLITVEVAIRRRPGMVGLPGADPAERVYRIGSSLDARSRGALKGISGELEILIMPSIVNVSHNAPEFKKAVDEYWSFFGLPVPADEEFLPKHKMGVPIKIQLHVVGAVLKNRIERETSTEKKMEYINEALITPISATNSNKRAVILDDSISDFLLLNYCLKYSRVANSFVDVEASPKIEFYIYEKANAIKAQDLLVKNRSMAMKLYESLTNDEKKIDSVLLAFKENPTAYEDALEKLLKIDELYNKTTETVKFFITVASDTNWETKYLINLAVSKGKLNNPTNSSVYYYNQVLIGRTIDEAVIELNSGREEMTNIKNTLLKEVNLT